MSENKNKITFEFGNFSHVGCVRKLNEDYHGYFETINGHLFIVCDGMGGHAAGEVASQLAVQSIGEFFKRERYEDIRSALYDALEFANTQIYAKSISEEEHKGMGTTAVVMMVLYGKIYWAYGGDSRLYLHRDGKLHRLTKDHSYVQGLVDQGIITDEAAETHPRKNEILKALGIGEKLEPTVEEEDLVPQLNDQFLLCSDGLNGMISDKIICETLDETELNVQEKAIRLVTQANEAGGTDNITVQIIKITSSIIVESESEEKDEKPKKWFGLWTISGIIVFFSLFTYIVGFYYKGVSKTESTEIFVQNQNLKNFSEKPVKKKNQKTFSTTKVSEGKKTSTIFEYQVKKTETLYSISKKFNQTEDQIFKLNNLKTKTLLKNQSLKIKVQTIHTIQKGESLSKIANEYQLSTTKLKNANNLKNNDKIQVGNQLIIPIK